jgi:hypothetical protein
LFFGFFGQEKVERIIFCYVVRGATAGKSAMGLRRTLAASALADASLSTAFTGTASAAVSAGGDIFRYLSVVFFALFRPRQSSSGFLFYPRQWPNCQRSSQLLQHSGGVSVDS